MTGDGDLAAALRSAEDAITRREPEIRALMPEAGRWERLAREAAELAARWPEPGSRPPLYGQLIGVKDIFHVAGLQTTGGSKLPPEALAGPESTAVTALRAAGALILGKTVSTEFAYFAPGPTGNPHDPAHTPGGSSSGSAAAVAAGYCRIALGTQTIGSIVRPAAFCGVVGFKPSYERISRDGVIPLSGSLDHVGFLTASVGDAAAAARAAFREWRAPPAPLGTRPRLGVPAGPYLEHADAESRQSLRAHLETLRRLGYESVEVPAFADFAEIVERHRRIVAAEAARVHADWYARFAPLYAPQTAELIERGRTIGDAQLGADLGGRTALRAELESLMARHGIDLWVTPSAPGTAPRGLAATGDPVMNLPWSHAGLPSLGLPAGRGANGLPLGLQFVGGFGMDEPLLGWGSELERALTVRA